MSGPIKHSATGPVGEERQAKKGKYTQLRGRRQEKRVCHEYA